MAGQCICDLSSSKIMVYKGVIQTHERQDSSYDRYGSHEGNKDGTRESGTIGDSVD